MPHRVPPLLALVMIIRDEARDIARTITSAKSWIDSWVVLDTGSADGTPKIVDDALVSVSGPGLFREAFIPYAPFLPGRRVIDYAATRNRALTIHATQPRSATFTLFLSGDETLEGGEVLRSFLREHRDGAEGAYCVEIRSGTQRWFYPRVLRTAAGWRYRGAIHEVPRGPDGESSGPLIPGVRIIHTLSDPARRFRRMREVDLPILEHLLATAPAMEDREAAIWNLAQTHEALADETPREPGGVWLSHKMAAMALYRRYSELSGIDQVKSHYAIFRYLNVAEQTKIYGSGELVSRLAPLAKLAPEVPEVRYMLAVHAAEASARRGFYHAEEAARLAARARGAPLHLPLDDRVEWLALRLAAACARAVRNKPRARTLAERGVAAGGPREVFAEFLSEDGDRGEAA